jgi:hypothetical protein
LDLNRALVGLDKTLAFVAVVVVVWTGITMGIKGLAKLLSDEAPDVSVLTSLEWRKSGIVFVSPSSVRWCLVVLVRRSNRSPKNNTNTVHQGG